MGMFDYVHHIMECPICGEKLDSFQTKDLDNKLKTVYPCQHNTLNFYTKCESCNSWIEIFKSGDKGSCTVIQKIKQKDNTFKETIVKKTTINICSKIHIDISLENYYILNEEARKRGILLDEFINIVLREYIDSKNGTEALETVLDKFKNMSTEEYNELYEEIDDKD